ncbi:MAG: hypothetical protein RLZZ618_2766, partial [Pseudomonadota bacterium]
ALDAMAGALNGTLGPLRHVAGLLHWVRGSPQLEPWAFACEQVVVPDFAGACGALATLPLGSAATQVSEPLGALLAELRVTLGSLLHHGLARLPRDWVRNAVALSQRAQALSLPALGQRLGELSARVQAQHAAPDTSAPLAPLFNALLALLQLHDDALDAVVAEQATMADPAQ